jgi:hypothetical protein
MNKLFATKPEETDYDLCPCSGKCCKNPSLFCPDHECEAEDFCEQCFTSECANCHKSCACDL